MRDTLKRMDDTRGVFTGRFVRYGLKTGYKGASTETVLLVDVRDETGKLVSDHCWLNRTKGFDALGELKGGERVRFEARVKRYKKGYVNRRAGIDQTEFDYRLSHPTKLERC